MARSFAQEAKKSEVNVIRYRGREVYEVQNATIAWHDFSGNRWKEGGTRNFTLALPEKAAKKLMDLGCNVKLNEPKTDEGEPWYGLRIILSFAHKDWFPVDIQTVSTWNGKESVVSYEENMLGGIDVSLTNGEVERADLMFNLAPNNNPTQMNPYKYTAYLVDLTLTLTPSVKYGGRYDGLERSDYVPPIDDDEDDLPF